MIGRLTGTVQERETDGSCVLDVGGVGYEVFVPLRCLNRLPQPPTQVTLHVHTNVKEDALTLFAFEQLVERQVFRALLGVNRFGPKLAMSVLSDMTAEDLCAAVALGDQKRLAAVSGVGKKTAARLVLELKDRLPQVAGASGIRPLPAAVAMTNGPGDEAVSALVGLGFHRHAAEGAVASVPQADTLTTEELLRQALSALA